MSPESTTQQKREKRVRRPQKVVSGLSIEEAAESWFRMQRALGRSPHTLLTRRQSLITFVAWLRAQGRPEALVMVTRGDIENFLIDQHAGYAPETVLTRYSALKTFFNWCIAEEEIEFSPMARVPKPQVPEQPPTVLTEEEIAALLKTCAGKSFEDRRDRALFILLIDTGMRLHEVTQLQLDMVDLEAGVLRIVGKGNRRRAPHFDVVAASALDAYLRARARYLAERPRLAGVAGLWVGHKGEMGDSGIYQMVRRRARQAGLDGVHPHLFRHGFADAWLAAGGTEGSLARLAGWTPGSKMLYRYGAAQAEKRAQEDHKKFSPANRLAGKDTPKR